MVQYPQLDRTLAALADPTRRRVLERLGGGSATISELAEPFGITLTGMKKHVRVLEDAELVTTEKVGRARRCSLAGHHHLDDVQAWVETYRRMLDERLDRFGGGVSSSARRTAARPPSAGPIARSARPSASCRRSSGRACRVMCPSRPPRGDRTKVTTTSLFHTPHERDGMLASGMERGMNETYARLDELLARLASA
jgi:DNA-binding transcriptional ArsR family regulator